MAFHDKDPKIQAFILKTVPDAEGLITSKRCAVCSSPDPTKALKDEISRQEFEISGMCQKCQDRVFDSES